MKGVPRYEETIHFVVVLTIAQPFDPCQGENGGCSPKTFHATFLIEKALRECDRLFALAEDAVKDQPRPRLLHHVHEPRQTLPLLHP